MEFHTQPWAKAFDLKDEDFTNCPPEQNPLHWALEQKLISEVEYLKWASHHYQIPILKEEYFSEQGRLEYCQVESRRGPWRWDLLPIERWNNITYVGCIVPEAHPISTPVCFVLLPSSKLKDIWHKTEPVSHQDLTKTEVLPIDENLFSESEKNKVAEPSKETIMGFDFSVDPTGEAGSQNITNQPTAGPPSPPIAKSTAKSTDKSPVDVGGLDFSNTGFSLDTDQAPSPPAIKIKPPPIATAPAAPAPPGALETPLSLNATEPIEESHDNEKEDLSNTINLNEFSFNDSKKPGQQPESPKPRASHREDLVAPITDSTSPAIDISVPISIDGCHDITAKDLEETVPLDQCENLEQISLHIFSELKNDFERMMWLPTIESGDYLPLWGYGKWPSKPAAWTTAVEIELPNVFRIAHSTNLPFHGPVFVNEINQGYFDLWNHGAPPKHLSLVPMCNSEKKCIAFFLGWNVGPNFESRGTLKRVEYLLETSAKHWDKVSGSKAS